MANDLDALEAALLRRKAVTDRPSLLILRTHIGYPSPDHTDDHEAHGIAFDAEDVTRTKAVMGIPDEPFWAPRRAGRGVPQARRRATARRRTAWAHDNAATITTAASGRRRGTATGAPRLDRRPADRRAQGEKIATRKAIETAFNATLPYHARAGRRAPPTSPATPAPSSAEPAQSADNPGGRQMYYGIREHGMGSAMVGMAAHGGVLPGRAARSSCSSTTCARRCGWRRCRTCKVCFVFTHDSVGVGEDGPTHQPVEQLATLRAIPGLHVIRPPTPTRPPRRGATSSSTTARRRWCSAARTSRSSPTARRSAAGAGVVHRRTSDPDVVLVGTGSEVAVCVARRRAARRRRHRVPGSSACRSWDRFEAAGRRTRESVLPPRRAGAVGRGRRSRSAGSATPTTSIGIDRFGASAPGQRRARQARHQRRPRRRASQRHCSTGKEVIMNRLQRLSLRVRSEPVARQPQAQLPHVG